MDDRSLNEISNLEQKIFDNETIRNLPFSFFEYIAQVIVNPEVIDEITIPTEVELEISRDKSQLIQQYINLINTIPIFDQSKSFLNCYIQVFLYRYTIGFKKYSNYVIRRIQTPLEYGVLDKSKIKNVAKTLYVAFDVDQFIPKTITGEIDIERLKAEESNIHNIKSFLSTLVSLPIIIPYFWEVFSENTTKGFFNMINDEDLEEIVTEVCTAIITFASRLVYIELGRNLPLNESVENVMGLFESSIGNNYAYPKYLLGLKEEIDLDLFRILSRTDNLTDDTKRTIYNEIHQTALNMMKVGMALPEYIYEANIRDASEFDKRDYQTKYVIDLYLYGTDGNKENFVFESYGIVQSEESQRNIVSEAFANNYLFRRFIA